MISQILLALCVYIVMIVFHEVGHWLKLQEYNKDKIISIRFFVQNRRVSLCCGKIPDYKMLNREQSFKVYGLGIWLGLFPSLLLPYTNAPIPVIVILIIAYFIGCRQDIKNIRRLKK